MKFLEGLLSKFNSDSHRNFVYIVEGFEENGDSLIYAVCETSDLANKIEERLQNEPEFDGIAFKTYNRELFKESYLE